MTLTRILLLFVVALALSACEGEQAETQARWTDTAAPAGAPVATRWYTPDQVRAGAALYAQHCATCHKPNAEGTADWKTRDANGNFPPPPLNGSAHAWHHPLDVLRSVVRRGGVPVGGTMPAFADKLSSREIDAILAWVQSHWSDRIYALWRQRDAAAGNRIGATRP
jgi:mono/diheme cytochrome c family protein